MSGKIPSIHPEGFQVGSYTPNISISTTIPGSYRRSNALPIPNHQLSQISQPSLPPHVPTTLNNDQYLVSSFNSSNILPHGESYTNASTNSSNIPGTSPQRKSVAYQPSESDSSRIQHHSHILQQDSHHNHFKTPNKSDRGTSQRTPRRPHQEHFTLQPDKHNFNSSQPLQLDTTKALQQISSVITAAHHSSDNVLEKTLNDALSHMTTISSQNGSESWARNQIRTYVENSASILQDSATKAHARSPVLIQAMIDRLQFQRSQTGGHTLYNEDEIISTLSQQLESLLSEPTIGSTTPHLDLDCSIDENHHESDTKSHNDGHRDSPESSHYNLDVEVDIALITSVLSQIQAAQSLRPLFVHILQHQSQLPASRQNPLIWNFHDIVETYQSTDKGVFEQQAALVTICDDYLLQQNNLAQKLSQQILDEAPSPSPLVPVQPSGSLLEHFDPEQQHHRQEPEHRPLTIKDELHASAPAPAPSPAPYNNNNDDLVIRVSFDNNPNEFRNSTKIQPQKQIKVAAQEQLPEKIQPKNGADFLYVPPDWSDPSVTKFVVKDGEITPLAVSTNISSTASTPNQSTLDQYHDQPTQQPQYQNQQSNADFLAKVLPFSKYDSIDSVLRLLIHQSSQPHPSSSASLSTSDQVPQSSNMTIFDAFSCPFDDDGDATSSQAFPYDSNIDQQQLQVVPSHHQSQQHSTLLSQLLVTRQSLSHHLAEKALLIQLFFQQQHRMETFQQYIINLQDAFTQVFQQRAGFEVEIHRLALLPPGSNISLPLNHDGNHTQTSQHQLGHATSSSNEMAPFTDQNLMHEMSQLPLELRWLDHILPQKDAHFTEMLRNRVYGMYQELSQTKELYLSLETTMKTRLSEEFAKQTMLFVKYATLAQLHTSLCQHIQDLRTEILSWKKQYADLFTIARAILTKMEQQQVSIAHLHQKLDTLREEHHKVVQKLHQMTTQNNNNTTTTAHVTSLGSSQGTDADAKSSLVAPSDVQDADQTDVDTEHGKDAFLQQLPEDLLNMTVGRSSVQVECFHCAGIIDVTVPWTYEQLLDVDPRFLHRAQQDLSAVLTNMSTNRGLLNPQLGLLLDHIDDLLPAIPPNELLQQQQQQQQESDVEPMVDQSTWIYPGQVEWLTSFQHEAIVNWYDPSVVDQFLFDQTQFAAQEMTVRLQRLATNMLPVDFDESYDDPGQHPLWNPQEEEEPLADSSSMSQHEHTTTNAISSPRNNHIAHAPAFALLHDSSSQNSSFDSSTSSSDRPLPASSQLGVSSLTSGNLTGRHGDNMYSKPPALVAIDNEWVLDGGNLNLISNVQESYHRDQAILMTKQRSWHGLEYLWSQASFLFNLPLRQAAFEIDHLSQHDNDLNNTTTNNETDLDEFSESTNDTLTTAIHCPRASIHHVSPNLPARLHWISTSISSPHLLSRGFVAQASIVVQLANRRALFLLLFSHQALSSSSSSRSSSSSLTISLANQSPSAETPVEDLQTRLERLGTTFSPGHCLLSLYSRKRTINQLVTADHVQQSPGDGLPTDPNVAESFIGPDSLHRLSKQHSIPEHSNQATLRNCSAAVVGGGASSLASASSSAYFNKPQRMTIQRRTVTDAILAIVDISTGLRLDLALSNISLTSQMSLPLDVLTNKTSSMAGISPSRLPPSTSTPTSQPSDPLFRLLQAHETSRQASVNSHLHTMMPEPSHVQSISASATWDSFTVQQERQQRQFEIEINNFTQIPGDLCGLGIIPIWSFAMAGEESSILANRFGSFNNMASGASGPDEDDPKSFSHTIIPFLPMSLPITHLWTVSQALSFVDRSLLSLGQDTSAKLQTSSQSSLMSTSSPAQTALLDVLFALHHRSSNGGTDKFDLITASQQTAQQMALPFTNLNMLCWLSVSGSLATQNSLHSDQIETVSHLSFEPTSQSLLFPRVSIPIYQPDSNEDLSQVFRDQQHDQMNPNNENCGLAAHMLDTTPLYALQPRQNAIINWVFPSKMLFTCASMDQKAFFCELIQQFFLLHQ